MGFIKAQIINFVLLAIPIGTTLAVLFGIRPFQDQRRIAVPDADAVFVNSECSRFNFFTQNRNGQNYTSESNPLTRLHQSVSQTRH
jgi:hypothetical protein